MGWKIIARITNGKEERIVHTTGRLESHAENALKKYFTDQVKAEEQRFRQWEQNIVNERIRLNGDLEEIQGKVKKLEEQVKGLQLKKSHLK